VPDRHANTKKISLREALEGIYFDYEGRKDEDPVLVGLLYRPEPQDPSNWAIKQLVLDPGLLDVDSASGAHNELVDRSEIVPKLAALAEDRGKPLISWSEHDWQVAKRMSDDLPFRYRNALPTVKRWKNTLRDLGLIHFLPEEPNTLANYERIIDYPRPDERFDVGNSIAYIRDRRSTTDGAIERWRNILKHNRHDLIAMRDIILTRHGVPISGSSDLSGVWRRDWVAHHLRKVRVR
jgi:hypothetical protein